MQFLPPENIFYLFAVAMVSFIICISAFIKRRGNAPAKALSALMLMTALWTLTYVLELSVVSRQAQFTANGIAYIPIVTVPVLLFIFIIIATGHQDLLSRGKILLLFIMPLLILIMIWTSNYHSLFYTKIEYIPDGTRSVMTIERGLFYWINIVYSYLCLLAGTTLTFSSLKRGKGVFKTQALILAAGTILPWIGSVVDIVYGKVGGIHVLQASFVLTGVIFFIGIRKYSFIHLSPIGRHVLIDKMEELMLVTDNRSRVVDLNPAMESVLQMDRKLIIGKSFDEVFSLMPDVRDQIYNMGGDSAEISISARGRTRHFNVRKIPLITGEKYHSGTLVLMSDLTHRVENEQRLKAQLQQIKELQDDLKELAIRDPLTGLYNRRFLEEILQQVFARIQREKGTIGFLFIDIDNFKLLNDTLGHQAGDAVLKNFGGILSGGVRGSDVACRYGGEEFLIMFHNTNAEDILSKAESMRRAFETKLTAHSGTLLPATFSAGIAVYPFHGKTAEETIKNADAAMYKAKREGKNRTVIFSE